MYSNFEELARICRQQALLSLSSETRAVLIGLAERYDAEAKKGRLGKTAARTVLSAGHENGSGVERTEPFSTRGATRGQPNGIGTRAD
jgi:hypothetical protein